MKKTITILLILCTLAGFAQKTQLAPRTVADSTLAGQRFMLDWGGELRLDVQDSSSTDINGITTRFKNYISLNNSYLVVLGLTKKRVITTGDTIQRQEIARIQFATIPTLVSSIYSNTTLKNAYKRQIRLNILTRKVSEE